MPGVLGVLNLLNMLNVLHVLHMRNMPMDASLACWALFLTARDVKFFSAKYSVRATGITSTDNIRKTKY